MLHNTKVDQEAAAQVMVDQAVFTQVVMVI
jgi:hypothetical protein